MFTKTIIAGALAAAALGSVATAHATPTSGMLKVGTDIQPGVYQVRPTSSMGYYALCADAGCRIDFDGSDATGLISNEIVQGPSYLEVGPGVRYVKISNLAFA